MNLKNNSRIAAALICLMLCVSHLSVAQGNNKFPTGSYKLRGAPMVFKEDGTFRIGDDKTLFVEGRFAVKNDEITLTDTGGQYACKGEGEQTGRYRWESNSEGLMFHLIKDGCEARKGALGEGVVARVK